jgi:hypothetical protein
MHMPHNLALPPNSTANASSSSWLPQTLLYSPVNVDPELGCR